MVFFYTGYILSAVSFVMFLVKFKTTFTGQKTNLFLIYLFCLFFVETLALLLSSFQFNNFFYNVLILLEFNILLFLYKNISEDRLTNKVIKLGVVLYNVVYFCSSFFYGISIFKTKLNTIAPVFGSLFIAVTLLLFLREMLLSEDIVNYKKNIFFWISTGLLLYYLGTLPLTAIFNFMKEGSNFFELYRIQHVLTIIMHSCFIIGLLWSWNKSKL
ncbi:hypothetical protein SAMN04487765_1724 [Tenacibaculum sp. MAR_2010_89]|nr:hypothetical protein SAMN04487765_1724 [Tenacibaculum sp. MAR_2010_89]